MVTSSPGYRNSTGTEVFVALAKRSRPPARSGILYVLGAVAAVVACLAARPFGHRARNVIEWSMMAAGPDAKQNASSLLARWRATAPEPPCAAPEGAAPAPEGAAPAPEAAEPAPPAAAPAPPRADPAALLRALEEAIAEALPPARLPAAMVMLEPLRQAVAAKEAERDPAALAIAFDKFEDVLESFLLPTPPSPSPEG